MDTIPGVGETVAQIIAAEMSVEMSQFPSDKNLSNWAGTCPGNHDQPASARAAKQSRAAVI